MEIGKIGGRENNDEVEIVWFIEKVGNENNKERKRRKVLNIEKGEKIIGDELGKNR